MFDISWTKLVVIALVALIVIAPAHLDSVMRWIEQTRRSWS